MTAMRFRPHGAVATACGAAGLPLALIVDSPWPLVALLTLAGAIVLLGQRRARYTAAALQATLMPSLCNYPDHVTEGTGLVLRVLGRSDRQALRASLDEEVRHWQGYDQAAVRGRGLGAPALRLALRYTHDHLAIPLVLMGTRSTNVRRCGTFRLQARDNYMQDSSNSRTRT